MKTRSLSLSAAALLLAAAPLVMSADPVPGGPIIQWPEAGGGNGHYYQIVIDPGIEWMDARAAASGKSHMGGTGYLATITSAGEDAFIESMRKGTYEIASEEFYPPAGGEVWVGGLQNPSTTNPAENWVWVTGEGSFYGVGGYANWQTGEPNDSGDGETYLGIGLSDLFGWNDEGDLTLIRGYVVEYEAGTARVVPGVDGGVVQVFNQANDPDPHNPLTAAYQKVLEGGAVKISCCVVEDTREGSKKYRPEEFDLGLALADTSRNPSCEGMPYVAQGTALLHKWHRGVPNPNAYANRPYDLGVCILESEVESDGVMFTADNAEKILGYKVDCTKPMISDRPFTGTIHLDPPEVDAPYVVRRSADCDIARNGLRSSTNLMVLNLRHDTAQKATNPYLSKDAAALKESIDAIKLEGCVDLNFLDTLASKVQSAKKNMQKAATNKGLPKTADNAVGTLDDATRQALFAVEPYGACPGNPKGLLVSRLMALKFAACSELQFPDGKHSDSSVNGHCAISQDIWDELPTLPGQVRCTGSGCSN